MQHVELIGIKLNFLSWEGSRIYSLITLNDETEEQETDAPSLKLQQQNTSSNPSEMQQKILFPLDHNIFNSPLLSSSQISRS